MTAHDEPPALAQYGTVLFQERATSTARRRTARLAMEQLEFHAGKRKRGWDGNFLSRMLVAATSDRDGCMRCAGAGWVYGCSPEPHLPAPPEQCPDCDPRVPGFAPVEAPDV